MDTFIETLTLVNENGLKIISKINAHTRRACITGTASIGCGKKNIRGIFSLSTQSSNIDGTILNDIPDDRFEMI